MGGRGRDLPALRVRPGDDEPEPRGRDAGRRLRARLAARGHRSGCSRPAKVWISWRPSTRRRGRERAGFLARTPEWWVGILPRAEKDARGGGARRLVVYETAAGPEAYAVYKTKAEWNVRGPAGTLIVEEAIGSTPRGTREIWRYLFEVDLVRTSRRGACRRTIRCFLLAAEPRRLGTTMGDGLWLRIVDVAAGAGGADLRRRRPRQRRPDAGPARRLLPLERRPLAPRGRRRHAGVARTAARPDLALDANDLGRCSWAASPRRPWPRPVEWWRLRPGGLAAAEPSSRRPCSPGARRSSERGERAGRSVGAGLAPSSGSGARRT